MLQHQETKENVAMKETIVRWERIRRLEDWRQGINRIEEGEEELRIAH